MKSRILDITGKKIDWDEVLEFTKEIFPKLESDLESALSNLNLQKGEPVISIEEYPPRIEFGFVQKFVIGRGKAYDDMEKELKIKQVEISKIVADIAEKYDLNAIGGWIVRNFISKRKYKNKLIKRVGDYTFKPKYEGFER